jgi:hypothetical protein
VGEVEVIIEGLDLQAWITFMVCSAGRQAEHTQWALHDFQVEYTVCERRARGTDEPHVQAQQHWSMVEVQNRVLPVCTKKQALRVGLRCGI